ncbi:hypothetical protein [Herbaspirillum aquaticum]|nr:hypothetical protein [Herbaspirillum aquaticum]
MSDSFEEFVRKQTEQKKEMQNANTQFSKERELETWAQHLAELYEIVERALRTYIEAGSISTAYRTKRIMEEFSGPYDAKEMVITIGLVNVVLEPIGTMLIGTKGRVDIKGPRGRASLVLIRKGVHTARDLISISISVDGTPPPSPKPKFSENDPWIWKISGNPPEMRFDDLTDERFLALLLKVANG